MVGESSFAMNGGGGDVEKYLIFSDSTNWREIFQISNSRMNYILKFIPGGNIPNYEMVVIFILRFSP